MMNDDITSKVVGRRQLLRGVSAFSILGLGGIAAGRPSTNSGPSSPSTGLAGLGDDEVLQGMCVLTPSSITGPFYLNLDLLRTDISEGLPGFPSRLLLRVVNAADCTPIRNAVVDVWHAHARGKYSGFPGEGTAGATFLRGIQFTDAAGIAFFDTIFPGWYPGRTPHIHLKVQPNATSEVTTQLYFEQPVTDHVFATEPYLPHGPNPVTNETDNFFLPETLLTTRRNPETGGLTVGLTIGVL